MKIHQNKYFLGFFMSLVYCVVILPFTESVWFNVTWLTNDQLLFSYLTKALFFLALFATIIFLIHFYTKLKSGSSFHKTWLFHLAAYFTISMVLLFIIWPGYWRWDEQNILYASQSYTPFSWQSIFTQLQYIFSLYLLPFFTGITIIQLGIISVIIGYIAASLKSIIKKSVLVYIVLLPLLLSPVVLLSNFYTLRAQIIAYLILLLLFKILLLTLKSNKSKGSKLPAVKFIGFTVLVSIIGFWRPENILYLAPLPLLWYLLGIHKERLKTIALTLLSSIVILASFYGLSKIGHDPTYSITSNLNTLQMMVHDKLRGNTEKHLEVIGQTMSLDILKQYPTYCDITSYWQAPHKNGRPLLNEGWETNKSAYNRAVFTLFLENADLFLKYRLLTYLAANYMIPNEGCNDSVGVKQYTYIGSSPYSTKLSTQTFPNLGADIMYSLAFKNLTQIRGFVWNVTPVVLLCLLLAIHAALRRRLYWLMIFTVILVHACLVFIAAPAVIFMYYFPVYLSGLILSLIYIALLIDRRLYKIRNTKHAIIDTMITPKQKVLIAIPAYNCAPQITRVLKGIDKKLQGRIAEVAVIDNGSTDNTIERALEFKKTAPYKSKLHIYKNNDNYNLGGTHKVAFLKAEKEGFTHVVILHGDDQAKSSEVNDLLDYAESNPQQTVLGSRFSKGSRLEGYDLKRILGNKVLNIIFSVITLRKLEDLGSGINLFYLKDLDKKTYLQFADKLTFNYELILDLVKRKVNFAFLPITWSEEDQVSNARNVTIFKTALVNVIRWRINKPTVNETRKTYSCKEVK